MRHFLILLALLPFFAVAQDSTVCIKPSTARYYLETEDEMYLLRGKDTTQQELITNLSDQLLVKDQIITTYKADSASYTVMNRTFSEEIRILEEQIEDSEAKLRKRKILEILGIIAIIIAAIL